MPCLPVVRLTWPTPFICALVLAISLQSLQAEPLLTQDGAPPIGDAAAATPTPIELSDLAQSELPLVTAAPPTTPGTVVQRATIARAPTDTPSNTLMPETQASSHNVIKEALRPLYNELSESGALDTWRDAKETLGLGQNSWEQPGAGGAVNPRASESIEKPPWQDPTQAPKSAAQVQLDREYDAYLLRQLIDDLKPWVLGLLGLYALGHLAKLTFKVFQWHAARRRRRHARHAKLRSSHRHHSRQAP